MKTIYLSGKISHLPEITVAENFEAAEHEMCRRIALGISPFHANDNTNYYFVNPLQIRPLFGIKKWTCYMIADLWELRKCDMVVFQNNWSYSRGAVIEYYFSKWIFKKLIVML